MEKQSFQINITKDKQQAMLSFSNLEDEITVDHILNELNQMGIKNGIIQANIEDALKNPSLYDEYQIAVGTLPTKPYLGKIEYFFQTVKDIQPSMDEAGNMDYKNLSLIANVKKDQILAKLDPMRPGEPGEDIFGNPVIPPQAPKLAIKAGKNTVFNEDKTELYAAKNGMVMLLENLVMVNDVYQVPNNVGTSTGNINFEGNVIVNGNVLTGFEVIANGNIEVFGVVEGARLKASGDIILHSGVSGMGRSVVEAEGNLLTKYIEQSVVKIKGDIRSGAILHSKVFCSGKVVVEGKKGLISGGKIISGSYVETVTLGSHMGTSTEIEIGSDPMLIDEYEQIKKRLPVIQNELEQMEKVITLLNKRREIAGSLDEEKQEMYASAIKNKIVLNSQYQQLEKKFKIMEEDMNKNTVGEIKIQGTVYSGTKLVIHNAIRTINDDVKSVKFRKDGVDLKMISIF